MMASAGQLVEKELTKISNNSKKNISRITGVPSGFPKIDEITLGWQPSDLIIIGGCNEIDKTNFIMTMLNKISNRSKVKVAVFSLDLTSTNFIHRMIHLSSGVSPSKLRAGKLKKVELNDLKKLTISLSKAPLYIDDTPSLSISELKKKALYLIIH